MSSKHPALHPKAQRYEPYNDGHWCFVYDASHAPLLAELNAADLMTGLATSQDADNRLAEIANAGLALAWELDQDDAMAIDVLVGAKLTSAQRKKADWLDTQHSFLSIPTGNLRIETLNSLSFLPEEATSDGCEIKVSPGEYDVMVDRVNQSMIDDEQDVDSILPTEVLTLIPVKSRGPKQRCACLTLTDALGEHRAWLRGGRIEDRVFHGTTHILGWQPDQTWLNLSGAQVESLGLGFGSSIAIMVDDEIHTLPYTGVITARGLEGYFGSGWFERQSGGVKARASLSAWQGASPWLLTFEGIELAPNKLVSLRAAEPWYEMDGHADRYEVKKGEVSARVVHISPSTMILNVGWGQLKKAKVAFGDLLELTGTGLRRMVYPESLSQQVIKEARERLMSLSPADARDMPLFLRNMDHWNDPEQNVICLSALVGETHGLQFAQGEEVRLSVFTE